MPEFKIGEKIETTDPKIEVTIDPANPLRPGTYRFQLVVVDDSGNESEPAFVNIIVRDSERPTAVIDAPRAVEVGQSFDMSGERSLDVGGRIVSYVWTLLG